jgi:hypothetical protein
VNFDSGRRIRRLERAKSKRQERNEHRYQSFKQAREQQRRMESLMTALEGGSRAAFVGSRPTLGVL